MIPALDVAPIVLDAGGVMYPALEFASVEGFRPLQLDLYLPAPSESAAPVPAIV